MLSSVIKTLIAKGARLCKNWAQKLIMLLFLEWSLNMSRPDRSITLEEKLVELIKTEKPDFTAIGNVLQIFKEMPKFLQEHKISDEKMYPKIDAKVDGLSALEWAAQYGHYELFVWLHKDYNATLSPRGSNDTFNLLQIAQNVSFYEYIHQQMPQVFQSSMKDILQFLLLKIYDDRHSVSNDRARIVEKCIYLVRDGADVNIEFSRAERLPYGGYEIKNYSIIYLALAIKDEALIEAMVTAPSFRVKDNDLFDAIGFGLKLPLFRLLVERRNRIAEDQMEAKQLPVPTSKVLVRGHNLLHKVCEGFEYKQGSRMELIRYLVNDLKMDVHQKNPGGEEPAAIILRYPGACDDQAEIVSILEILQKAGAKILGYKNLYQNSLFLEFHFEKLRTFFNSRKWKKGKEQVETNQFYPTTILAILKIINDYFAQKQQSKQPDLQAFLVKILALVKNVPNACPENRDPIAHRAYLFLKSERLLLTEEGYLEFQREVDPKTIELSIAVRKNSADDQNIIPRQENRHYLTMHIGGNGGENNSDAAPLISESKMGYGHGNN